MVVESELPAVRRVYLQLARAALKLRKKTEGQVSVGQMDVTDDLLSVANGERFS